MAISTSQYNRLLERLNILENLCNDINTILSKVTTAATVSKVITTFETSLDDIEIRLTTLEEKVTELVEDPYDENEN